MKLAETIVVASYEFEGSQDSFVKTYTIYCNDLIYERILFVLIK